MIESYVSTGEASYFTNAVTEVSLEDGANLSHTQDAARESARVSRRHDRGGAGARQPLPCRSRSRPARRSRARTSTRRSTAKARGATLNGLYMLDGEQHCDHQTQIEHAQPNCFSRELYKGVLDGASHGVFNGKVYVDPIAQKTDGKQTNNDAAAVGARAGGHEAAARDLRRRREVHARRDGRARSIETALFYMKSRGINKELARRLLTYAFAADVLETIEIDACSPGVGAARRCSDSRE